jgi:hypothetical protein
MNFEKDVKKELRKIRVLTKSDRRCEIREKHPDKGNSFGVVIPFDDSKSGLQDFFYNTDD